MPHGQPNSLAHASRPGYHSVECLTYSGPPRARKTGPMFQQEFSHETAPPEDFRLDDFVGHEDALRAHLSGDWSSVGTDEDEQERAA